MRLRVARHFGVVALYLVAHLGMTACSSSKSDDADVESTDSNTDGSDSGNNASNSSDSSDSSNDQSSNSSDGSNSTASNDGSGSQDDASLNSGTDDGTGSADSSATADNSGNGGDKTADATKQADGGSATAANSGAAAPANGTEGDLQDIISEMNGQQGGDSAAANQGGDAAKAGGDSAAPAPANTTAAAAPAAPAAQGTDNAAAPAAAPAATAAPATASAPTAPAATTTASAAPAAPSGKGLPEMGSKMPYIVQHGDTLAKIAQKVYGDEKRWQEIASLSGINNPNRIYPGDIVYYQLSEQSSNFAQTYESQQRQEVTVGHGDTLATIAAKVLGDQKLWKQLWRQNDKIDNPDKLTVGQVVYYVAPAAQAAINKISNAIVAVNKTINKVFAVNKTINHKTVTVAKIKTAAGMVSSYMTFVNYVGANA